MDTEFGSKAACCLRSPLLFVLFLFQPFMARLRKYNQRKRTIQSISGMVVLSTRPLRFSYGCSMSLMKQKGLVLERSEFVKGVQ
jgi:hypothetical protein